MSNADHQSTAPMHQVRPRRRPTPAPTFEDRITREALADYRREQRTGRARAPLVRRPAYTTTTGPSAHLSPNNYQGHELHRNAGVTAERFIAFTLPSRVGNWLHYPDGRKERFPGS